MPKGAFERCIEISRSGVKASTRRRPSPKPLPTAPSDHLPSCSDTLIIPAKELRALCSRFGSELHKQLMDKDFEEAEVLPLFLQIFVCQLLQETAARASAAERFTLSRSSEHVAAES